MVSHWRTISARIIAAVLAEHPDDTPEQRKALRNAYPFGERAHYPYKIWLSEITRQKAYISLCKDYKPIVHAIEQIELAPAEEEQTR